MNNVMYNAVVQYYAMGLFTADNVKSFVGLWITQDQCNQILNGTAN
ncbi:XkdX family protein [Apilactobacillus nanyangensis]|nr:XkdX family protein [Apilactobacillus nanyangensis]